jgi:hypothetical protein
VFTTDEAVKRLEPPTSRALSGENRPPSPGLLVLRDAPICEGGAMGGGGFDGTVVNALKKERQGKKEDKGEREKKKK